MKNDNLIGKKVTQQWGLYLNDQLISTHQLKGEVVDVSDGVACVGLIDEIRQTVILHDMSIEEVKTQSHAH